ncbi:uncharacterized protein LOC131597900 [Vicia villosa]|uniref:uncharacterized protein LOC131597900 n=1 Tax=Vicia villosa TaxID=3911 RepID=UPI00273C3B2F|nr:uncharacterized protein LOC131597900 [Vicia villosa]
MREYRYAVRGGGWMEVKNRRLFHSWKPRWDTVPYGGKNLNFKGLKEKLVNSIYFSKILEFSVSKELFELFGCIGRVVEVSISPRRNNIGKRFGFARFVEVEDERLLAVRIDNVIIDGKKIHANIPRYQRNVAVGGSKGKEKEVVFVNHNVVRKEMWRDNRSFAEVVNKERENCSRKKEEQGLSFCYMSKEEDRMRLNKAYVCKVIVPGSAYNIQTHFEMEGFFAIKVSLMGGNLCLLEEMEEGYIEDLIGEGETWWRTWFTEIKKWEDAKVDDSRVVWIRIFGILAHAWSSDFFMGIADTMGTFVCIDEHTSKGNFWTLRE